MDRELKAKPLGPKEFEPFGDVIDTKGGRHFPINEGAIERYHDLARVEVDEGGRTLISIFESNQVGTLPHRVALVERHVLGSQAFIPLDGARMIVVVASPGEPPSSEQLQAFVTNGEQGVNYRPGVWHMPLIAFEAGQRFLVVDRGGPGENCDEHRYENENILVHAQRSP